VGRVAWPEPVATTGPTSYQTSMNTGALAKESVGPAFFLSVPAGPVQVTATPLALGDASATYSVYVHGGAFMEFGLPPTPLGP
jgi:hypothetical protein